MKRIGKLLSGIALSYFTLTNPILAQEQEKEKEEIVTLSTAEDREPSFLGIFLGGTYAFCGNNDWNFSNKYFSHMCAGVHLNEIKWRRVTEHPNIGIREKNERKITEGIVYFGGGRAFNLGNFVFSGAIGPVLDLYLEEEIYRLEGINSRLERMIEPSLNKGERFSNNYRNEFRGDIAEEYLLTGESNRNVETFFFPRFYLGGVLRAGYFFKDLNSRLEALILVTPKPEYKISIGFSIHSLGK